MRQIRGEAVRRLALGVAAFAFAVTGLALAASTASGAQAQAGSQAGATIDQTGWWSRTNAVPTAPVPGVTVTLPPLTAPAPPSVPAGAIAVGATAGTIDKAAAVGIVPGIRSGTVERAILTIAEAANGRQVNNTGSDAVIVACPITQFWVGGSNGNWSNVPPNSCTTGKVAGTRAPDGVWSFDLTPIATLWLSPGVLAPNGVVLLPEVASPSATTFQVVLRGDASSIGIDLAATPPAPRTSSAPTTTAAPPAVGGGSPSPITTPSPTTTAAVAITATTAAPVKTAAPVSASRSDSILGNLPRAVILLLLLALIVAVLLMVALGPLGEPATGVAREGGVSRALAARERATAELAESNLALEAP